MQRNRVVVVGAGMVGAATAIALAQKGADVVVVESNPNQPAVSPEHPELRVSALNLASEALLTSLKVWPEVSTQRLCPYTELAVWEQGGPQVLFSADQVGQNHLGHIVENETLRMALWQVMLSLPQVTLKQPCQVTAIEQTQGTVEVTLDSGEVLTADLLVAADGANSNVRQLAGIGVTAWDYRQHALVVNISIDSAQQAITWQEFVPTGPKAFLPLWGQHASLVWYHQAEQVQAMKKLSHPQLAQAIAEAFPERLPDFDILQVGSFPLSRQHANQYVAGRVVLVGDAAHQINPLAGQGVNLGFKDVASLVSVLADQPTDGWLACLQRYQSERRPRNLLMMSAMDGLYATFSNRNPLLHVMRNAGLWVAEHAGPAKSLALKYALGQLD